ncbi:4'-phosphopantetheinyl transferase family protein [Coraliomargarita parva]|uniref:4'-phosphopantetheinyl transferase family protein n=1 Tax=Coraliomargarita parva TaxID=3014050 RepID=UPI0022B32991|nr:4'-phosphopantetheinyl transferase superfamily protein [Coraliomargarita parva]
MDPDYHTTLNQLLPEKVYAAVEVASHQSWESLPEEDLLEEACDSRKLEFQTGRFCARKALEQAGATFAPILRTEDGLPVWPRGYLGSITHSKGLCGAVVASKRHLSCVGLDFERADRLSTSAMQRVVHEDESEWVDGLQLRASVLFSLKEAFYKAQFPCWGLHANFHDLSLIVDLERGAAQVQSMHGPLVANNEISQALWEFRLGLCGSYVLSLCYVSA